ncbi:MAG: N(4)-(beta-N-acetylglucosaminyl)-L-asparaginase [Candidatus Marinimicrobia bacterium]|nr:N(4)-(beta-N-acetylglucosaminyl)-L-asparaginase [Candidatus Neomarinimicrobiota bacterium]
MISAISPVFGFQKGENVERSKKTVIISTWNHGHTANLAAVKALDGHGNALDAVEAGCRAVEEDPEISSVGYGGTPDFFGEVTLDACIMDWKGNAGSVACLKDIMYPASVARKVMENTKHVMLVGDGAKKFALDNGFTETNLLTEAAHERWLMHLNETKQNIESHDTVTVLAQDSEGRISGACSTSGLAFKLPGRVGDSPIIGAGLYVDNEVGAAGATGVGEEVIRMCGSYLIVELMRQGYSPEEACLEACRRSLKRYPNGKVPPVSYIALRKDGKVGAGNLSTKFEYALYSMGTHQMINVPTIK